MGASEGKADFGLTLKRSELRSLAERVLDLLIAAFLPEFSSYWWLGAISRAAGPVLIGISKVTTPN